MASSSQVRRSRREQLEAQRIAKAKKDRRNKILFTGGGVLILLAVIGTAIWGISSAMVKSGSDTPPNAVKGHGIAYKTQTAGAPTLEIFMDYNCSGCRAAHLTLDAVLNEAIESGKVNVVYVGLAFVSDTSRPAAIAAACSDFQDVFPQFHHELFLAAGDGLTTTIIRETIPDKVGLINDALTTFQACYDTSATGRFVDDESAYADKMKFTGTPNFRLDGEDITKQLWNEKTGQYDPDLLREVLGMS